MTSGSVRVTAIVVSILGVIGGIFIASKFDDLGIIIFIAYAVSIFLLVFPWFVLAEMMDNQERLLNKLSREMRALKGDDLSAFSYNSAPAAAPVQQDEKALPPLKANIKRPSKNWTCKKCGYINPMTEFQCKSCGKAR